jgi:type II secretory ATPase GspE/PulE/Tfp pilus assembly ATPase PilB-like protein
MAKLDIAEKRLPQDGRIRLKVQNKPIDFRVSTLPSFHGESVVRRMLDREQLLLQLTQLGLSKEDESRWKELIHHPFGILLVTGPTGSGKTTTLYTSIQFINKPNVKIITVEDPIEYQIPGVNQVAVRPEIGLSFAAGLRSILRQAPNKILVGEIRDHETAAVAVDAALTGHLVFSTLHTNDAPSSVSRLLDMGVRAYLVASAVQAIVAQRLVRTICPHCRESFKPDSATLKAISVNGSIHIADPVLYKGKGCPDCSGTGYLGRIGIFELLVVNDDIRELIGKRASHTIIRERARKYGMRTLREDGIRKVLEGITTWDEVMRVTHGDVD